MGGVADADDSPRTAAAAVTWIASTRRIPRRRRETRWFFPFVESMVINVVHN